MALAPAGTAVILPAMEGPLDLEAAGTLLLPGCGHTPHREKPEETLRAMVGFVRRLLS